MSRLIMCIVLLLMACAGPGPSPVAGFRDPVRPIYSSAVFDASRLAGAWHQIGDFATAAGCTAAGVRFAAAGPVVRIDGQICLAGVTTAVSGTLTPVGPGRFRLAGVSDPLWVLWADTDVRTLVIGTPSGRFGVILNRDPGLPHDRVAAARDVLSWNGYDLNRLHISP